MNDEYQQQQVRIAEAVHEIGKLIVLEFSHLTVEERLAVLFKLQGYYIRDLLEDP